MHKAGCALQATYRTNSDCSKLSGRVESEDRSPYHLHWSDLTADGAPDETRRDSPISRVPSSKLFHRMTG